ncbi:hypothetical protein [Silvanigrella sp.]|jgi:hypothetical protein|uniref:hypothetical protein n=1 Tax=Silvanigrella sp. TaxID=2024976 RepID=UPI0037C534F7
MKKIIIIICLLIVNNSFAYRSIEDHSNSYFLDTDGNRVEYCKVYLMQLKYNYLINGIDSEFKFIHKREGISHLSDYFPYNNQSNTEEVIFEPSFKSNLQCGNYGIELKKGFKLNSNEKYIKKSNKVRINFLMNEFENPYLSQFFYQKEFDLNSLVNSITCPERLCKFSENIDAESEFSNFFSKKADDFYHIGD